VVEINIIDESKFVEYFNRQWCWRVLNLVHIGTHGEVKSFPVIVGSLETGRAENCGFNRITSHSQVPRGDYLYLQVIAIIAEEKPAYTRLFINITAEMFYSFVSERAVVITAKEVLGFFPSEQSAARRFLEHEGCLKMIHKLCDLLGKEPAEVELLN